MKGLFITGTDTNVGKTYISCLIAAELKSRNINVVPRKPIESGCIRQEAELIPQDATALKNSAQYTGSLQQVCPYRFEQAISPQRAALINDKMILIDDLVDACKQGVDTNTDFLLVEGAGGFYSPICENSLNADLAQELGLPVVLIADDRVGCINHILLSAQAIASRNLNLLAVILNQSEVCLEDSRMDNLEDLTKLLSCPVTTQLYQSASLNPDTLKLLL